MTDKSDDVPRYHELFNPTLRGLRELGGSASINELLDEIIVIRIGSLISFPVLFQSKRWTGNVGPDTVRDFRGAMMGRADKGPIITTGGFTREARREATRDGAPPIDLIDGELLVGKLKDLRLGVQVTTRQVEEGSVDEDWFGTV